MLTNYGPNSMRFEALKRVATETRAIRNVTPCNIKDRFK
jgi:hypothetical protein